jgi:hypothetical protein
VTFTTAKGYTTTTISLTPAAPQAGSPITLTATVNNNGNGSDSYTFSGNVTFYDNGKVLATVPVATNTASTTKTLSGGVAHSITATYSGDSNWNTSTSTPVSVTPTLLPSSVSISSSSSSTLAGVNIVFTATVYTTATNSVGPTGTVTFYDTFNGTQVQLGVPATLAPNGPNQSIAVFNTTGLQAGQHSIYAIYNGDSNFANATAPTYALNLTDFNVNMVPQNITLHPGQTGQVVLLAGAVGNFTGTISFGCTPPSNAEITCSFSPVSITGGGSTTLTIVTTGASTAKDQKGNLSSGLSTPFAGTALALLTWWVLPRRSRRLLPKLLLLVLSISLASGLGCGSGNNTSNSSDPAPTDSGTPLGTQILTITAAGSDGVNTVRHTYQYQITMQ